MSAMLDWLIIGGGVHGTHLSLHFTQALGVPRDRVRVLDPHAEPLARWDACARASGMAFLRSPHVHQIDLDASSLLRFAKTRAGRPYRRFIEPYFRPSLDLFRAHSEHVIRTRGLRDLRVLGKAERLTTCRGGFRIETERGALEARKVLLAISASDMPVWPSWGRALADVGAPLQHVFEAGFDRAAIPDFERAAVVGGGITAAQLALALASRRPGGVTLVTPHAPRVHQFDSDPGWIGPLNLDAYHREPDMGRRRAAIRGARHKGSMPPDVHSALRRAVHEKRIALHVGAVVEASLTDDVVSLHLAGGGSLEADRVVLATGFEARRPGGALIDRAISDLGLRCASCGYPIVDASLRWHPGLHVTGALAELELGPVARNIVGARLAAERFTEA